MIPSRLTVISQALLFTCNVELSLSSAAPWSGLDPVGLALGVLSVLAFSAFGVLNRVVVDKDWGACLNIGLWDDHTCFFRSIAVSSSALVVVGWSPFGIHSLH